MSTGGACVLLSLWSLFSSREEHSPGGGQQGAATDSVMATGSVAATVTATVTHLDSATATVTDSVTAVIQRQSAQGQIAPTKSAGALPPRPGSVSW
jgi:hypothetical protein